MSTPMTQHAIRLEVGFQGHPELQVPVSVYAFNPYGKLLATAPVVNGFAELPLAEEQARTARLMVAPPPGDAVTPTLPKVKRMNPYKPVWTFKEGQAEYKLLPIPELFSRAWTPTMTRIRGQVVKPIEYHGTTVEVPVAGARVIIYEVDPVWLMIDRLAAEELLRVRDDLLRVIPAPEPGFLPVTAPIPAVQPALLETPVVKLGGFTETAIREMPLPVLRTWMADMAQQLPVRLELAAILKPWIRYEKEEQARIYADPNGRFDVTFNYLPYLSNPDSPSNPLPDLYFEVECLLDGQWTLVYQPRVAQSTYFEYAGQEVTLRVTDPRVLVHPPAEFLAGYEVGVLTIGNYVNIATIHNGLTAAGAPFGGCLEPHVLFGEELARQGAYYRWSYRPAGAGVTWRPIAAPVIRHYVERRPNGNLTIKAYPLGPVTVGAQTGLFQVQPLTPPTGQWAPEVDGRANTASAHWNTPALEGGNVTLAAGLYDLKLEVFNAAGQPMGVDFQMPQADRPCVQAELVDAPEARIERNAEGHEIAFRLQLVVDNQPCVAEIPGATVAGREIDGCGFITFAPGTTPDARIAFRAHHPDGFATFRFDLVKGRNLLDRAEGPVTAAVIHQHGPGVVTSLPAHDYTQAAGGTFTTAIPVPQLLAPCQRAAFGEMLYVWATATDGWNRLSHLDRYAGPVGFAIEPETL